MRYAYCGSCQQVKPTADFDPAVLAGKRAPRQCLSCEAEGEWLRTREQALGPLFETFPGAVGSCSYCEDACNTYCFTPGPLA